MSELAHTLKRVRKKRGLDQTELARRVGVSQSTISRIEQGQIPGADVLAALARALGMSADRLLSLKSRRRKAA